MSVNIFSPFVATLNKSRSTDEGKIWCEFMGERGEACERQKKSPSFLSHHMGMTAGESWCSRDFALSPSDGRNAVQEREAASCGCLEGELPWVKGRGPHVNTGRRNHGEKRQEDSDTRYWDLPDV